MGPGERGDRPGSRPTESPLKEPRTQLSAASLAPRSQQGTGQGGQLPSDCCGEEESWVYGQDLCPSGLGADLKCQLGRGSNSLGEALEAYVGQDLGKNAIWLLGSRSRLADPLQKFMDDGSLCRYYRYCCCWRHYYQSLGNEYMLAMTRPGRTCRFPFYAFMYGMDWKPSTHAWCKV